MSPTFTFQVNRREYQAWLMQLQNLGYKVTQEHKGGIADTVKTHVLLPDGEECENMSAINLMDAEKGRRVYLVNMKINQPETHMPA